MLDTIMTMLKDCDKPNPVFLPTNLYNETWMTRVTIDWFSKNLANSHQFSFIPGSVWFSEGLLPSRFLPKKRGDKLADYATPADAIIGNFKIGGHTKKDLQLLENAKQFTVIEAKIFEKLSSRTSNSKQYDQVARSVACMSEALRKAEIKPSNLEKIGFYVVAPSTQIEKVSTFREYTDIDHIKEKVSERVNGYKDREEFKLIKKWHEEYFISMLDKITIECLSWEGVIEFIHSEDTKTGENLSLFYDRCLKFNRKVIH